MWNAPTSSLESSHARPAPWGRTCGTFEPTGPRPTSCLLGARWRRLACSVGPREYTWLDVVLAAMLRGEWRQFERQLGDGLARVAAARTGMGASWPDDRQIEEAAHAFRYERDLVAGDEILAWLERSGLTIDAWTDYLVRQLVRDRSRDRLEDVLPPGMATAEIAEVDVAAEGICSGTFDRFLRTLAGRAATATSHVGVDPSPTVVDPRWTDRRLAEHAAWIGALDPGDVTERVLHLGHLESAFHAQARAATTADALATQVTRHRLEWTRVDLERVSFETADAAREAVCCIREDGLTLSEVAIASRQPVRDTRDLLERLEPDLRDAVLGAGVDQLVGPVTQGSRHEIAWVVGKRPADLADPIVRARAEAAAVDQMVARAILARVRWAERPRPETGSAAGPDGQEGRQHGHL